MHAAQQHLKISTAPGFVVFHGDFIAFSIFGSHICHGGFKDIRNRTPNLPVPADWRILFVDQLAGLVGAVLVRYSIRRPYASFGSLRRIPGHALSQIGYTRVLYPSLLPAFFTLFSILWRV
jgi:hypothetical protein